MPNTDDEEQTNVVLRKRKARMQLNRESAKRSRQSRKDYLAALEAKVASLLQDIQQLEERYEKAQEDNACLHAVEIAQGSLFVSFMNNVES